MINFKKHTLSNGLRVLLHQDVSSQMVAVDVLYDVGARDESINRTGFAHLFEHLMFGGSKNILHFDSELQKVGGENNAYTTNDLTNYYIQLPKQNIETALWLESDRMLQLNFSEQSLAVQRKVVCEEFKEHYLNKPYGDVWKLLREMCYTVHPYQWMTIGKELSHIEQASLKDVEHFFYKHYTPSNAILSIVGNFDEDNMLTLINKWFGAIPTGKKYNRHLPKEPIQTKARKMEVERAVNADAYYKCWHISNRKEDGYYIVDVISDILAEGDSSQLFESLVKQKKLFSKISAYHLGSHDEGLFVIEGKLNKGVNYEQIENAVNNHIEQLQTELINEIELSKIKNQIETAFEFENISVLNKANLLAYYELLGNASMINTEIQKYHAVTPIDIKNYAINFFREENSNTLYYKSNIK